MTTMMEQCSEIRDPSSGVPVRPMHAPKPYSIAWVIALLLSDLTMFTLSALCATILTERYWNAGLAIAHIAVTTTVVVVVWLLLFSRLGLYHHSLALSTRDELYYTVTALCLGVAPLFLAFTIVPSISSSRIVTGLSLLFAVVTVGGSRVSFNIVRDHIDRRHLKRVALIGSAARIKAVAEALNFIDDDMTLMVEIDDIDTSLAHVSSTPGIEVEDIVWFRAARTWGCDRMILTEMPPPKILPYLLEAAARHDVELSIAPPRIRTQAYSLTLQTDGQQVLIVPKRLRACRPFARLLKRIVDVLVAMTALIVFAPIMALAALAIFLESGRPILYRQERVGRDGNIFEILKFRSMPVNAEAESGPVWRNIGDARATRVGAFLRRTSVDELPQLLNVLRGDMSVVGPRPERPHFTERFRKQLPRYDERSLVRPGITGWSQIHLDRNSGLSQVGEKLSYDLFYIENWSLFMDLSILVKTGAEFLFHRAS